MNGKRFVGNVDCFVGSGGTMTAEAGLLGIPTISMNSVPNRIEDYLVKNKIIIRSESPNRDFKEVFQSLNDINIIKEESKMLGKLVASFEDPYQVLLKTIRTL